MAEATCYLTIEPQWAKYPKDRLAALKVKSVTANRPARPFGVVVKLHIRIPDAVFKPLAPEVTIDVPEGALDFEPIITVEMPEVGE